MDVRFGREARRWWRLREDASFLNHGSYGGVPLPVMAVQAKLREELETHPDAFMARVKPDGRERAVREVAAALAACTGTTADRIALVENATTGVQAVLDAIDLGPGDEVLCTDQLYGAVRRSIERRCRAAGAQPRVVVLPLPAGPADIVQRVLEAGGPRTRLAVLDHLTSASALELPLAELVPALRARGIPVLVDGAHCLGQLPLDLPRLGADWYVANAHKWLYSPRGSAVLFTARDAAATPLPAVTSHYIGLGFPDAFDYTGTRDYTAWLTVPAALRFHEALAAQGLDAHNRRLVDLGSEVLAGVGGVATGTRAQAAWMRAFILPQRRAAVQADADAVMATLWERERIQIRCAIVDDRLLLRFCAQAYVEADELPRLGEALRRHGWPEALR